MSLLSDWTLRVSVPSFHLWLIIFFSTLRKYDNPSETGDNPKLDNSREIGDKEHRQYQILMGTLIWVGRLGRSDVSHATSSLSRFSTG